MARGGPFVGGPWECGGYKAEKADQCVVLRDIFDNPFLPRVEPPACLPRKGGTVRTLAEAIYRERTFGDMPALADALEDAGCTEPRLLTHLRSGGPHFRGCWALDLVRG